MILNSYAVLSGFVAILRLLLGLLVLGVGLSTLAGRRPSAAPEVRLALEGRYYLVFMLALLLLGLNLASWPMLYLLLQSYVPQWPGVMCIYGVMQIGKGSLGPSRFLPDLLCFLQWVKPGLVFVSGSWFVLYLLNRRTQTAPLLMRLFMLLLPLGTLVVADATAELTYLVIPKKEEFPASGCCVAAQEHGDVELWLPALLGGAAARPWLYAASYGLNGGLILALVLFTWRAHQVPGAFGLSLLLLLGGAGLVAGGLFLVEVAAPTLLHLPFHHCAYDLISDVPEAVVAVAIFLAGWLFLGWACVVRWLGHCRETEAFVPATAQVLLRLSLWGYLTSVAMLSLELLLA